VGASRPAPRATRGCALAAAALLLAACGPAPEAGRHVVVRRHEVFEVRSQAPPPRGRLSLTYDFAAGSRGWRAARGEARAVADGWRLEGEGGVSARSPRDPRFDADAQQQLVLRASTTNVERIDLLWETEDGGVHALPGLFLEEDARARSWTITLSTMRRRGGRPAITEGFARLEVRARARADAPCSLTLHALSLLCPWDPPAGSRSARGRFAWRGETVEGLCVWAPATVTVPLDERARRLETRLAAPRRGEDVRLTLEGAAPPGETGGGAAWTLDGGGPWTPLSLERARGAEALTLRLEGPATPVLVARVLGLAPRPGAPPPVIVYVEDTLRRDRLSSYGYPRATDPHLATIAAAGARFTRAYAASNWTRPSVSSLLSGWPPRRHGNQRLDERVVASAELLPEVLADAGYVTLKLNTNKHVTSWSGLERGFDLALEPHAFPRPEVDTSLTSHLVDARLGPLLERFADTSFFVYVQTMDPHAPYRPPPEALFALVGDPGPEPPAGAEARARFLESSPAYDAEIRFNDARLARLDERLAALGLEREVLFAFLSDHGEAFGEHGAWEHYRTLHEEEIAIPWIVRWPGRVPPGLVIDAPATHEDVAPTLLGLLGLPAPAAWQGVDHSGALLGRAARRGDRVLVVESEGDEGHLLAAIGDGLKLLARVRDGTPVPEALYDLAADPRETRDRLADPDLAAPRARLLEALHEHLATPRADGGAGADVPLDPARREWLEQMGYLR